MKVIEDRFIKPFGNKKKGNVGVELEFPLINMDRKPIEEDVAQGLLSFFLQNGFDVEEKTLDGKAAFISNDAKDVLSFDNSYNNFEFSMNYGDNLCDIANRFFGYFEQAQQYLTKYNYILTGMGSNPYKEFINKSHVNFPVYNMIDKYLHAFAARHNFPDFPAYISSSQTHLDVSLAELPFAATVFAKLDFVRALLFSNSPMWDNPNILCCRDYLWENSAFPETNTGKVDSVYSTLQDITDDFKKRKMFNIKKDGEYIIFPPVLLTDYFNGDNDGDIDYFLSFKNIEITARTTLEVRSDCEQPVYNAFAPSAFSLGILYNLDRANELMESFRTDLSNTQLRNAVINQQHLSLPKRFVYRFVEIAYDGLLRRQKGEEKFLLPLFERAERNTCPAKDILVNLAKGESIENIIQTYSNTNSH